MIEFPKTLRAARQGQMSLWELGDALKKEATEARKGPRGTNAVAEYLKDHGINYTPDSIYRIRATAVSFPESRRHHDLSFEHHAEAKNPDTMDAIIEALNREGINKKKVTKRDVRKSIDTYRKTQRQEYRRATGKTPPPQRRDAPPPKADDIPLLSVSRFDAAASTARQLAETSLKEIKPHIAELKDAYRAGLHEAALEAANAWFAAAAALKTDSTHLYGLKKVVNE